MTNWRRILVDARTRLPLLILLAGAVVSLVPLLALAWYAFPSADDYCYAVEAHTGWWHLQKETYLSISGRYTSTLLLGTLSQWDLSSEYAWFCLATLVATFLAFRGLIAAVGGGDTPGLQLTVAAAVATAVLVGMLPSPVEAFFWMASSATYQWGIIAYLVWLTLLIRIARDAGPREANVGLRATAAALTVLLPGFNEILMPVVLVTMTAFVIECRRQRLTVDRFMRVLLGLAVIFTAVSLLAPGNVSRSHSYPDIPTRHDLEFALTETTRQTLRFVSRYSSHSALWVAACAAWWWGRGILPRVVAGMGGFRAGAAWVLGLAGLVYLTLFPLYWEYGEVNYTGEGRTYNVTYFVFCATVVLGVGILLGKISERLTGVGLPARRSTVELLLAGALALLMVSSPGVSQAYRALRLAPEYLEIQQARESVLRAAENRGRPVVVNAVRVRPVGLFWGDIQPEETHWINSCVATYYNLGSVRTPQ